MLSLWALPGSDSVRFSELSERCSERKPLAIRIQCRACDSFLQSRPAPQWAALLVATELCPLHVYLQAEDGHVRAEAFVVARYHT